MHLLNTWRHHRCNRSPQWLQRLCLPYGKCRCMVARSVKSEHYQNLCKSQTNFSEQWLWRRTNNNEAKSYGYLQWYRPHGRLDRKLQTLGVPGRLIRVIGIVRLDGATQNTVTLHKKLTCRRYAARCFVPLNISLSHSRSFKVTRNDTLEYGVYKSLLVSHCNYVCISYRFWDIQRQIMAWLWKWC